MSDNPDKLPHDPVADMMAWAEEQARAATRATIDSRKAPTPSDQARPDPGHDPLTPEEKLAECAQEPETDIGNARRLITRHGHEILFVPRVDWHGFDGRRWKEDEDGSVVRPLAQRTAEMIEDEAVLLTATPEEQALIDAGQAAKREMALTGKPAKDWPKEKLDRHMELMDAVEVMGEARKAVNGRKSARHRHAKSTAGTSKLNNMLTEAAPHVAKMVGDLNKQLYSVNLWNGTLLFERIEDEESDPDDPRFTWTCRLKAHDPRDYISKLAPFAWKHGSPIPVFDTFFKTVQPDPDIRAFLKRFFGYCLLGITTEQCLLFFYGAGRNGKSTLVDLLCDVLGDYAVTLSIDSFAGDSRKSGSEATPDLARLPGARLVAASEPEMGVKMKDALIKTLTGGEKIAVRRLHQDFIEMVGQFKIILSGNHKPRIDDDSDGIWRRVHMVPWEVQIPPEEVDRTLPAKLRLEAEGVLAWMVEGALEYLNCGLAPPARVLAATAEYREESDPIGAFIRNGCEVTGDDRDRATPEDMCIGFANFARKEGLVELRSSTFARRLPDQTRKAWLGPDGKMHQFAKAKSGTTVYVGIRVKREFATPPPSAPPERIP